MGLYLYSILSHPELKNNMSNKYNISFPTGKAVLSQVPKKIKIEDKSKYTVIEETELDINQLIYKEPLIPVQHIAVLELAGAYMNPGGLCSYEKFGYYFDSTLYGDKCFYDYNNLPMVIYFNTDYNGNDSIKKSRVISIAAGDKKADFKKSKICDIRDKDKQTVLGYLKNYKIYINSNIDINDFKEYYGVTTNMEQLLMYLDKGTKISIDSIINYLENPPLQPVNQIESMIKKIYENMNNKNGGKKTRKIRKTIKMKKSRKIKNNKLKNLKKNKTNKVFKK
jgi:ribosomal protein S19E (S16A)